MRRNTKRLLTVLVLTICAIAIGGSAAIAVTAPPTVTTPRVVVGLQKNTIALYDTAYNAIAKSYDSTGAYQATPAITWSASPDGIVHIIQTSTGHSAKLEGVGEGTALVRVTWQGASDSVLFAVTKARVIKVTLSNNFKYTDSIHVIGVMDTLHAGDVSCMYVRGIDRRGGSVTGKSFTLKSSNAGIAAIGTGDSLRSPACPDTTIDPAAMAKLLGIAGPTPAGGAPSLSYYIDHQMPKAVGDAILRANGIAP